MFKAKGFLCVANLKKINDQDGCNTISNRFEFVNCQLVNGKYLTTFGC